eukprot:TRINITY_DN6148_c0_g1_i2.p1 TRINITY_DN6148_c0_g1~~TRINITY_DN6148_c0_g1_i2.p1  ORF type:complete len:445 (+),score=91.68 TRINITY_DN6148_c0_g1_i2:450-1784(+)
MRDETLDKWRQFFKTADTDICTLIENAILVAASDFPQELRIRRDTIAQKLFAPSFVRCIGCGRENCIEVSILDRSEHQECEKSSGYASPDSKITSSSTDNKSRMMASSFSYDEAEALTEEIELESLTIKEVNRIKEILLNPDESPKNIHECLQRLELMDLSVDTLEATCIGRTVNTLKRHRSLEIQTKAKQLIRNWKELVAEWVKATGELAATAVGTSSNSVSAESNDVENGLPSPPLDEGAFTAQPAPIEMSKFFDGMDEDGNFRIPNNHDSDEDREGSHAMAPDASVNNTRRIVNNVSNRQGAVAENKLETKRESCIKEGNTSEHEGLIRPPQRANVPPRPPRDLVKFRERVEERSSTQCKLNRKKNDTKYLSTFSQARPQGSNHATVSYEELKRKLHDSYEQEKNAKKQRTVQLMDLHQLPNVRCNSLKTSKAKIWSQRRH